MKGVNDRNQTTMKRRISGPGNDCWATIADSELEIIRQSSAKLALIEVINEI